MSALERRYTVEVEGNLLRGDVLLEDDNVRVVDSLALSAERSEATLVLDGGGKNSREKAEQDGERETHDGVCLIESRVNAVQ